MTRTNQAGLPVQEDTIIFGWDSVTDQERDEAIKLILTHLKMKVVRTNATKHGTTEIELRSDE